MRFLFVLMTIVVATQPVAAAARQATRRNATIVWAARSQCALGLSARSSKGLFWKLPRIVMRQ
jgi:hypothetical protein